MALVRKHYGGAIVTTSVGLCWYAVRAVTSTNECVTVTVDSQPYDYHSIVIFDFTSSKHEKWRYHTPWVLLLAMQRNQHPRVWRATELKRDTQKHEHTHIIIVISRAPKGRLVLTC